MEFKNSYIPIAVRPEISGRFIGSDQFRFAQCAEALITSLAQEVVRVGGKEAIVTQLQSHVWIVRLNGERYDDLGFLAEIPGNPYGAGEGVFIHQRPWAEVSAAVLEVCGSHFVFNVPQDDLSAAEGMGNY